MSLRGRLTVPPLYQTNPSTLYCHTCGRVISSRNASASQTQPTKYCSERCRREKPTQVDRVIEEYFVRLLSGEGLLGQSCPKRSQHARKGGGQILVQCSAVENRLLCLHPSSDELEDSHEVVGFGLESTKQVQHAATAESLIARNLEELGFSNPFTRRSDSNFADHEKLVAGEGTSKDVPQVREAIEGNQVGWNFPAEIPDKTMEMKQRMFLGQKRAKAREMIRRAARRGVVFGFVVETQGKGMEKTELGEKVKRRRKKSDGPGNKGRKDNWGAEDLSQPEIRRKCEAVQHGKVVEPSFAKGDWEIRWRE